MKKAVGPKESRDVAMGIARGSITIVRNDAGLLPLSPGFDGLVLVISPKVASLTQVEELTGAASTLGKAVRSGAPQVVELLYPIRAKPFASSYIISQARRADLIIVGTYRATAYPPQAKLVQALLELGKPMIVVALREPYDLREFPTVSTYVATYGTTPFSLEALGDILFARVKPTGKLPVTIPGLAPGAPVLPGDHAA